MLALQFQLREIFAHWENMSAFKRKRGGQNQVGKKAKKVKFVPDDGEVLEGDEQQKKNEVTIPPPVSMVNVGHAVVESCSLVANAKHNIERIFVQ